MSERARKVDADVVATCMLFSARSGEMLVMVTPSPRLPLSEEAVNVNRVCDLKYSLHNDASFRVLAKLIAILCSVSFCRKTTRPPRRPLRSL